MIKKDTDCTDFTGMTLKPKNLTGFQNLLGLITTIL